MKKSSFPGFPFVLLGLYILVAIWSAIHPVDRGVWITEAITSFVPVLLLGVLYAKNIRLSNFAYVLAAFLPIMHVIGAHYTFANVPFGWFDHLFGFSRDMYDRVAHFTVGFYAYGLAEVLYAKELVKNKFLAWSYALFTIMAIAAAYEIFEWLYAVNSDPNAGLAILGSQGDVWDTQKDMLMDSLGAVASVVLFLCRSLRKKQQIEST